MSRSGSTPWRELIRQEMRDPDRTAACVFIIEQLLQNGELPYNLPRIFSRLRALTDERGAICRQLQDERNERMAIDISGATRAHGNPN